MTRAGLGVVKKVLGYPVMALLMTACVTINIY